MLGNALEHLVFRLAMRAHTGHPKGDLSHRKATFSVDDYREWRHASLISHFDSGFSPQVVQGKRVLDFGCGRGELSYYAKHLGAQSVIGTDLDAERIRSAHQFRSQEQLDCEFILSEDPQRIPVPDASVDVILCFDVMEHVMNYREVFQEWWRILAPGGLVLVWWVPWWHPYGHHLQTMVPLPWVHAFMPDDALLRICARIYDTPHFQPRLWHFDEAGNRVPNPYTSQTRFTDLNKLTIREFDRTAIASGFEIARKEVHPFTGDRLATVKKLLARSPWPDFFSAYVVYEIRKA